jgi:hypothetical protein
MILALVTNQSFLGTLFAFLRTRLKQCGVASFWVVLGTLIISVDLSASPRQWLGDIEAFEKVDKIKPPAQGSVVFVGSSSIVRWTSLETDFPDFKIVNRGFGGCELADSLYYADRIVVPYHPKAIVMYAGENDLDDGRKPEIVAADFKAFVTKVRFFLPGVRVIYISIKPSPLRWKHHQEMELTNALIAAECAKDPGLTFVNVFPLMLDTKGQPRLDLFKSDKLHMNPAGYAIWTPLVAAELRK